MQPFELKKELPERAEEAEQFEEEDDREKGEDEKAFDIKSEIKAIHEKLDRLLSEKEQGDKKEAEKTEDDLDATIDNEKEEYQDE